MKRSQPIRRVTPLRARSRLNPVSAKNRAAFDELRDSHLLVRARSRGWCEYPGGCGLFGEHFHHVKPRSKGVDHSPENLLHLCGKCHAYVHAHPREARALGTLR